MVVICGIWVESVVLFWYKSNNNVELSVTYKIVDVVKTSWVKRDGLCRRSGNFLRMETFCTERKARNFSYYSTQCSNFSEFNIPISPYWWRIFNIRPVQTGLITFHRVCFFVSLFLCFFVSFRPPMPHTFITLAAVLLVLGSCNLAWRCTWIIPRSN